MSNLAPKNDPHTDPQPLWGSRVGASGKHRASYARILRVFGL